MPQAHAAPKSPATPQPSTQPTSYQVLLQRMPDATGALSGAPQNAMEYRALVQRRSELGGQLESAQSRRRDLAAELRHSDGDARAGLVQQISVLDSRIIRLEQELDQTGDAIANASPEVVNAMRNTSRSEIPFNIGNRVADQLVPLTGIISTFFLLPIAIAFARLIWKRASAPPARQALPDAATAQRLEQLQQSVDSIAVEVERISEGQRYVAKLYGERDRPAIGA